MRSQGNQAWGGTPLTGKWSCSPHLLADMAEEPGGHAVSGFYQQTAQMLKYMVIHPLPPTSRWRLTRGEAQKTDRQFSPLFSLRDSHQLWRSGVWFTQSPAQMLKTISLMLRRNYTSRAPRLENKTDCRICKGSIAHSLISDLIQTDQRICAGASEFAQTILLHLGAPFGPLPQLAHL